MRGVHWWYRRNGLDVPGSSPHARGPRDAIGIGLVSVGIIPACAGSTRSCFFKNCGAWDHPRMRGVHVGF